MRFPLLAKTGSIVLVGLMLTMALFRIELLVRERQWRGSAAVESVERAHAAAQAVLGPLLERACTEEWDVVTGTGKDQVVNTSRREFRLQQVPARLAITSRTKADPMWRGLYKINAWVGHFSVAADFTTLAALQPRPEHPDGRTQCGAPVVVLALSDVRGVRSAAVSADGQAVAVEPGTGGTSWAIEPGYGGTPSQGGLHSTLSSARVDGEAGARPLALLVELDLVGTSQLAWVPAAGSLRWTLDSDWPHPSFGGQFAPEQRSVRADGFSATWNVSSLATTAPADVGKGLGLCKANSLTPDAEYTSAQARSDRCLDLMAVGFIDPVDPHVLTDRATKYDLLFIVLTFIAVALIEVLSGRRVHPVQYLLVGSALALFFLLLLSLSEHLAFGQAYAIASAACAGLLGFYATSMLGRRGAGAAFGLGIGLLYGLLYTLLRLEQSALVVGSLMLFLALAAVMTLTRRIDWYALFARVRADRSRRPEEPA